MSTQRRSIAPVFFLGGGLLVACSGSSGSGEEDVGVSSVAQASMAAACPGMQGENMGSAAHGCADGQVASANVCWSCWDPQGSSCPADLTRVRSFHNRANGCPAAYQTEPGDVAGKYDCYQCVRPTSGGGNGDWGCVSGRTTC